MIGLERRSGSARGAGAGRQADLAVVSLVQRVEPLEQRARRPSARLLLAAVRVADDRILGDFLCLGAQPGCDVFCAHVGAANSLLGGSNLVWTASHRKRLGRMNSTERQRLIRHFSELIAEALNATDNAARERLLAEAQAIIERLDQQQCADPGSRQ